MGGKGVWEEIVVLGGNRFGWGGGICFEEYGFWVEHRRIGSFGGIGFGVKNGFSEQSVFFGRK